MLFHISTRNNVLIKREFEGLKHFFDLNEIWLNEKRVDFPKSLKIYTFSLKDFLIILFDYARDVRILKCYGLLIRFCKKKIKY